MNTPAFEPRPEPQAEGGAGERLAAQIEQQARRRKQAGAERVGNLWQQVARVGTLGWMIVLPIVGGAVLGHMLDRAFDTGVRFALALMALGVATGGYALWRAIEEGTDTRDERHDS